MTPPVTPTNAVIDEAIDAAWAQAIHDHERSLSAGSAEVWVAIGRL